MTSPDPRLTAYLLGDLPEPEAAALERECFENPGVFARLLEIETALADDYVRRRLPSRDREKFERHYLASPHNRERIEFAEALAAKIDRTPRGETRAGTASFGWWQPALVAAVLVLAVSTAWLWRQSSRLRSELARSEQSRALGEQRARDLESRLAGEQARARELTSELDRMQTPERETPPAAGSPMLSLLLTIPSTRASASGPAPTLTVPPGAPPIRLQLAMTDAEYASYEVSLRGVPASLVITRQHLRPQGPRHAARLDVILPPGRLTAGDYILTLSGERRGAPPEPVSQLLFRVVTGPRSR